MTSSYDIRIEDLPDNIRDIADEIGLESTIKLVRLCGGQSPYIPKMEACEQAAKHRVIYDEYKASKSGKIYSELALKHNYTESYVRDIIRKAERVIARNSGAVWKQAELFE